MKSAKVTGRPMRGIGHQGEIRFGPGSEGSDHRGKNYEVACVRMLDNLKLALFFCKVQGQMSREKQ